MIDCIDIPHQNSHTFYLHYPNDQFPESGQTDVPYRVLAEAAGLSRASVSAGLKVLEARGLISRTHSGRNVIYKLHRYNVPGEWAKLPARALYSSDFTRILPFKHFTLRNKNELNALKLYYLVLALRHNAENLARAAYDTIHLYTNIPQNDIRGAISFLAAVNLVHVEASPRVGELGYRNGYRPVGISPRIHAGTAGRRGDWGDGSPLPITDAS
ncbi:MAG: hypothetical protein P4L83_13300 [Nevskia sp.]|nr:hypothetical protein [Nevskia sp.]